MQFLKAQSDIIAVVLIVLIAIGLLAVAYTFGFPLIQKNQDRALEERAKAFFNPGNVNSLPAKIEAAANSGGKDTATLAISGVTRLYPGSFVGAQNNSIDFSFQSTVSSYANDVGWISLTGAACPPASGIIGQDDPSVVCVRADSVPGGFFNITYKLYMRGLEDAEKKNGFAINLLQHPASQLLSSGTEPSVRIEFDGRREVVQGAKTLIITDVKILLV